MSENGETGYIYLATNKSMPGLVKIGMTSGDVNARMRELSADTGVPTPYKCSYYCKVKNPALVERQLHKQFDYCRESDRREFFRADWRAVKAAMQMMKRAGKFIAVGKRPQEIKKSLKVGRFTLVKWTKENVARNVRHVLSIGGSPDQADETRKTALMWAAELIHNGIVRILLDANANPNKTDDKGRTALMFAAAKGNVAAVKMLLDAGAYPNAISKEGEFALDNAVPGTLFNDGKFVVSSDRVAIVQRLHEAGAKPGLGDSKTFHRIEIVRAMAYAPNIEDGLALSSLALGHIDALKMCLDAGVGSAAASKALLYSMYHYSSLVHSLEYETRAIKLLLDAGADPNARYNLEGQSVPVLLLAVLRRHSHVANTVDMFLKAGADPNAACDDPTAPSADGKSSVIEKTIREVVKLPKGHWWSDSGKITNAMIAHGARVDAEKYRDPRALFNLVFNGHSKIMGMLLEKGVDPDTKYSEGKTLLGAACQAAEDESTRGEGVEIVRMLLDYGAIEDINIMTEILSSEVYEAVCEGLEPLYDLALSALVSAREEGDIQRSVDCWKECQADRTYINSRLSLIDKHGRTALAEAAKVGALENVQVLLSYGVTAGIEDALRHAEESGNADIAQLLKVRMEEES